MNNIIRVVLSLLKSFVVAIIGFFAVLFFADTTAGTREFSSIYGWGMFLTILIVLGIDAIIMEIKKYHKNTTNENEDKIK